MSACSITRFITSAILFLVVMACRPPVAAAQDTDSAQNVVYVEAFGTALFFGSVNYERMLSPEFSARIGVSPIAAFPVMANYLPGIGAHRAEVGLGLLVGPSSAMGTGILGYRYQPENGGLVFRASLIPSLRSPDLLWAGVSFGVAF